MTTDDKPRGGGDEAQNRVPLRCRCGALGGSVELAPRRFLRVVCYCDDCQAYAAALERADLLDGHGGTELFQTYPANVEITRGREHLACLRMSAKGMYRWHTACCRTPIGNSLGIPRAPFIGLANAIIDHGDVDRDALFGPPTRVQGRFAVGGVPEGALETVSIAVVARTLLLLARGSIRRAHQPSPFFDVSARPVVEPRVLSADERAALRPAA